MPDTPEWLRQARSHWTHRGTTRPSFAVDPADGQESVWDYPRPPAIVADTRRVLVRGSRGVIADTTSAVRVLETSHPPAWYIRPEDIADGTLVTVAGTSICEWKGEAEYLASAHGEPSLAVGWRYNNPYDEFVKWAGWISFYPNRVACFVDDEPVRAQTGGFYGGWITNDVVGPFKGEPGTSGW